MKIIHITWGLKLGGLETMLVNIANEQSKTENVTIIVINDSYDSKLLKDIKNDVNIVFLKRKIKSRSIIPILKLYYYLLKINPNIIHVHSPSMGNFVKPLMHKVIYTIHDTNINIKLVQPFTHNYAISYSVKKDFEKRTHKKAIVVYNGIKVSDFIQKKHNIKKKELHIVQVSRLMHQKKGQHILIEAIDILRKKGIHNIFVDLIGEGESWDFLNKMIKEKGLNNNIHLLGPKPYGYISQHLCDYDLLVQPSLFEGFGLTVAEAIAAKIPVLVSDIEGPMEIINKGEYGFFFKKGDAYDCANKIEKIMKLDTQAFVNKAYNYIAENFNVTQTAKQYIKEYKKIIS